MTDVLTVRGGFLALAVLATGLAAGLFYAFDVAVMRGLAATDDRTFVTAMREINIKILNGLFAFSFGGALIFTLIALGLNAADPTVWWIVAAAAFYAVQFGITFGVNVPLNNALVCRRRPGHDDRSPPGTRGIRGDVGALEPRAHLAVPGGVRQPDRRAGRVRPFTVAARR